MSTRLATKGTRIINDASFPQPHARPLAISEFDAGRFEGVLDRLKGLLAQFFAALKTGDCVRRHGGELRQITDAEV